MKHKHLALTLGTIFTSFFILLISCKKINEPTSLGGGLIPPVDNIHTFDTTLEVQAFNDTFTLATDTLRYSGVYNSSSEHFLGRIDNDPLFGKTDAKLYLELKPPSYKYTFSNRPDSLHLDSVVLVLSFVANYGDTLAFQTVNVYEIPQSSNFGDTAYTLRKSEYSKGQLLGSRTFQPFVLKDSVRAYKDTTSKQLRIRLDDSFGQRLLSYDTTGTNNAFASDSLFRTFFKGFALESASGNALIGINLEGVNTKLAIYYKDDNNSADPAKADTLVSYFTFSENASSAYANFIKRDYAGTPLEASVNGTGSPDDLVYIQNSPGSFATIKTPGLGNLNNNIIHRAELIMEQVYDASDTLFPSSNLYLDAWDPQENGFRTIPYDVSFDVNGNSNLTSFGIVPLRSKDAAGNNIRIWRMNLTRYVQHVVNKTEPVYDLRLYSPVYVSELYRSGPAGSPSTKAPIVVNAAPGKGRVRLGGGNHPTQKMRLHIVYSKI